MIRIAHRLMIFGGTLCGLGLAGAIGVTIFKMTSAFRSVGTSGVGDASALAESLTAALGTSWVMIFLAGVGFLMLLTGALLFLFAGPDRRRWKRSPGDRS